MAVTTLVQSARGSYPRGRDERNVIPLDGASNPSIDTFLGAVEHGEIASCSVWTSDVVLDATVPNWRFRVEGPDAIRTEYSGWFADPGHFEELRRMTIPDGEVVQYLLTWVENGVQHSAHHLHVLELRDGLIAADTVLCGGRWPASLMAEMEEMAAAAAGDSADVDE